MGFKVNRIITATRDTILGIMSISTPPHHNIYSIEGLKQLIFDLKCVKSSARISMKLVSKSGVGTVVASVVKAGPT